MRKIIATEYVTLDGVMEAPNLWSFDFWNEEAAQFKHEELFTSDALLLGRITYEGFASAWPAMTGTGDFGERMNSIAKYVVSTTLKKADWNNTTIIKENVVDELKKLKKQSGMNILLSGSATLLNSLMPHDIIDEYRFMLHPVVVGSGKKLFEEGLEKKALKLVDVRTFSTDIVILTYRPNNDAR